MFFIENCPDLRILYFPNDCVHPSKLGFWKLEGELSEFMCWASKSYWMRYREKVKGSPETEWVYKGFKEYQLQKLNPEKTFHEGAELEFSQSMVYNWGTRIEDGWMKNINPAACNPKMRLEEHRGEYFWKPFETEKDNLLPSPLDLGAEISGISYVNH